uniref:Uncharacterized protein n=1 Tax=Percolomonas cosmopolitus TaxID=63605 RepID=A0A7S1KSZ6_9EUKA|mmetsp:Transcript_8251/g.30490  ORF Transcript_8251/g.30490 Transcript_8251/m.30490 type:complete len:638 (+) Transcript_8251:159-2072(+)
MDAPLPPDQISELLNDALPPGYKLIRARCGCGHLHNIISGKPIPPSLGDTQHRMSYKLLQRHHTEINQQNEVLKKQLVDLRERVINIDSEKQQLYEVVQEYEERNDFLEGQIKQLLMLKQEYDDLNTENEMIKSEASKGHVLVQQWKERCDELQMEKESALTQVRQYREKIEELLENDQIQNEQRTLQTASEREENKLLKQKCDNLQQQYENVKRQFDETIKQQNDELTSLMSEVRHSSIATGTKGSIGKVTTTAPAYIRLTSSTPVSSKQRSKLWKKLREEIVALKQRNVVLAKQIMNVTKENQNNTQQHEMELRQAREEIDTLHNQLNQTENNNAAYALLKREHEKLTADLETASTELATSREEIETLKKTSSTQQSSINRLQNDNKTLRDQRDRLQNKESISRLHDRNDQRQLLQEIDSLKERVHTEASQFQTLRHQMDVDYRARLKEMRDQKEYLETRCQVLKQQVEILQRSEASLRLKLKESWREAGKLSSASRESLMYSMLDQENSTPNVATLEASSNAIPSKLRSSSAKKSRRINTGSSSVQTTTAPVTPSKKFNNRRKAKKIEKLETSLHGNGALETDKSEENAASNRETSVEPTTSNSRDEADKDNNKSFVDTTPIPRDDEPQPSATS